MSLGKDSAPEPVRDEPPATNTGLMVVAGVLLAIPIIALMWVTSYAKEDPKLFGFPFFFWYQFLWVFITSALTYTAYRLVLAARGGRRGIGRGTGTSPHVDRGVRPETDRRDGDVR